MDNSKTKGQILNKLKRTTYEVHQLSNNKGIIKTSSPKKVIK